MWKPRAAQVKTIAMTSSDSSAKAHPTGPSPSWIASVTTATVNANQIRFDVSGGAASLAANLDATFELRVGPGSGRAGVAFSTSRFELKQVSSQFPNTRTA